jgi:dehydrogenase/reductase SDR family member 7B
MMVPGFINTPILRHALDGQGNEKGSNLAVNENGMDPKVCADQILRAVRRGRKEVTIGFAATFSVALHRFMPNVSRKVVSSHPLKWLRKHFPWFVK